MAIRVVDGELLMVDGKIVTNADCCCGGGGGDPGTGCGCLSDFRGSFDIEFADVANAFCDDADTSVNGIHEAFWDSSGAESCEWDAVEGEACSGGAINVTLIVFNVLGTRGIGVQLSTISGATGLISSGAVFQLILSSEIDCASIGNLSIPLVSTSSGSLGAAYDMSAATCRITAN